MRLYTILCKHGQPRSSQDVWLSLPTRSPNGQIWRDIVFDRPRACESKLMAGAPPGVDNITGLI